MADIVITEFMDDAVARDFAKTHDVLYDPGLVDAPAALAGAASQARALIVRNRTRVDENLLAHCRNLKVIGRLGVGLERIDLAACQRRGIVVCPARGANAVAVAEYAIAGLLILVRGAYFATPRVIAGEWPRERLIGGEISGRRLGLVGFGDIGRHAARRAAALGMHVIAHDPFMHAEDPEWRDAGVLPVALDELLAASDAISLHVPLTDATRRFFDARVFARMKRGAVFINTTRGGIVDEDAMIEALKTGQLGGAMIDVFEHEPLGADAARKFDGIPNLILTPHIAGVTVESNRWLSIMTVNNVIRVLNGQEPLTRA